MAEATLNDVIARLRSDNEKQVREQRDTTDAVNSLTKTIKVLMILMELQILKNQEAEAEKERKKSAAKSKKSSDPGSFLGLNIPTPLLILGRTLGNIAAFAAALALATEGLGPALRDVRRFISVIGKVFTFPLRMMSDLGRIFGGRSLAQYVSSQIARLSEFIRARFTFDPRTGRYRNLETGRFGRPGAYQRVLARLNQLLGNIRRIFSAIRVPDFVLRNWQRVGQLFSAEGRLGQVFQFMRNNRLITGILRFLRPLAAILSMIDGFRNAAAEMEDREGTFNTWLGGGVGGFVSGTIGSFFGEFVNLIRDAIFWPIKQILPDSWLIENEDGSLSINRETNWFTNFLGGLENIDFNRMLRDMIQIPFDQLGLAFDFLWDLFTGEGDARERLQEYWDERGFFGTAVDVLSWALNLVMTPINSLLREVENAFFGADPERERETFTERVSRYVSDLGEWLMSFIPSVDDIREWVARSLSDRPALVDFLGLSDFLPLDAEEFERRAGNLLEGMEATLGDIERYEPLVDPNNPAGDLFGDLLIDAQRQLERDRADLEALMARAQTGGVEPTIINNYSNQYETFQFPNAGSVDGGDTLVAQ